MFSQTNVLAAKTLVKKNAVLLRWAPPNKNLWENGIKYGYKIERISLSSTTLSDSSAFRSSTLLTSVALKPHPATDTAYWRAMITQNKNTALVYAVLYPKTSNKNSPAQQKEEADKMLYGLMLSVCNYSAQTAQTAALYFCDSSINNNTIYAYRISLFGAPKNTSALQTHIVVDARIIDAAPPIDSLSAKTRGKKVELRWNIKNTKDNYSGYFIERSTDSLHFSRVNHVPHVAAYTQFEKNTDFVNYSDTVPNPGSTYYFRIRGINYFGEIGSPGNCIKVKTKTEIDFLPIIDSAKGVDKKSNAIYWTIQGIFDTKQLKGFAVVRASKANGKYALINTGIISQSTSMFVDEKPQPINYYKVGVISLSDDTVFSLPALVQVEDNEPPQMPAGLTGTIDKAGIVKLIWKNNSEIDLMGYRVFRSNSLQEDYVEVSKKIIEDTVFSDVIPINTLTKNIYYSITALDFNYNNSAYAHPLKLSRPDNLPPVAPIFSDVFFDSTGVHIKWINSSSADVSKYTLERKAEDASSNTKLIKQWSAKDSVSAFIDTAVTEGTSYTYFISTTDSSGNSTQTKSGAVNFVRGLQKSVNAISAVVNRSKKTIEIQWKYDTKGVQKFILYKSIKGEPMRLFKTLPANTFLFTDNQLYINNIYLYAIKAVFTNGAESRMDYIVEVNY